MKIVSKYRSSKITVDGIKFDSKAEAAFYKHLKNKQAQGLITTFEMQVPFELQEGFGHPTRKTKAGKPARVTAIKYVTDFVVTYPSGQVKVIDVKGMQTVDFKLKAKLFMRKYGVPLYLAKRQRGIWEIKEF
ncbi:DUF1064 domain-containing protein [Aerococcaceae bacterium 50-4]